MYRPACIQIALNTGCDIVQPNVEGVTRVNVLEQQFRDLHGRIESELEDKKVTVWKLKNSLPFLPSARRDLCREEKVSDLFLYLNPPVSFLDYGLTEYIINTFGSKNLKKMMKEYSEDVVEFMKKTTVKTLLDYLPGPQTIPQGYTTMKATIDEDPKTYTLYDVDQLRKHLCDELKLDPLVFKTNGLKMANSFIIEWLVPSVFDKSLLESAGQLDLEFYNREHVLEMACDVVREEKIFPFPPDSKTQVPSSALQKQTTMDTVSIY